MSVKIDNSFNGKPPRDDYLISLLKKAYSGKLKCYITIIKSKGIKPYSDYIPEIREQDLKTIIDTQPPIYVYPKNDVFVMSDDYYSYYSYLKLGFKKIPCVVLGKPIGKYIVELSEPFNLPPPNIEIQQT